MGTRIGVDLGGTKIEAVVLDEGGTMRARRRVPTPRDDYPATLAAIASLVEALEREAGERGTVGIGMPGALSPATGLVKNANSVWLNGRPFDRDLSQLMGRPLRFANDANCFALSEAVDGAAAGAPVVFGVILGTGTGGGVVVNGRILTGPNAIAGEWGHNPLPWPRDGEWPGPPCYCGKTACVETFLSGPGLARDYLEATGRTLGAPEIVAGAAEGDREAEAALQRYEDRMARALAMVVNVLDGGMSQVARLYSSVPHLLLRYAFSDSLATRIVPPAHGDSSGVRGAAWLWDPPIR
jgi:fructokinase